MVTARLRGTSSKSKIVVKVSGFEEVSKELARFEKRYPEAVAVSLFEEGVEIFSKSQDEVPRDSNTLARSGIVFLRKIGLNYIVVIGYGTAYALKIHENTKADANRTKRAELALSNPGYKPKGAQVGKSKYLIDPFNEAMVGIGARTLARTQRRVMSHGTLMGKVRAVKGKAR